jgi:hypothetical protein
VVVGLVVGDTADDVVGAGVVRGSLVGAGVATTGAGDGVEGVMTGEAVGEGVFFGEDCVGTSILVFIFKNLISSSLNS